MFLFSKAEIFSSKLQAHKFVGFVTFIFQQITRLMYFLIPVLCAFNVDGKIVTQNFYLKSVPNFRKNEKKGRKLTKMSRKEHQNEWSFKKKVEYKLSKKNNSLWQNLASYREFSFHTVAEDNGNKLASSSSNLTVATLKKTLQSFKNFQNLVAR